MNQEQKPHSEPPIAILRRLVTLAEVQGAHSQVIEDSSAALNSLEEQYEHVKKLLEDNRRLALGAALDESERENKRPLEQLEADALAWEEMRQYNMRLEEEVRHWKYDHQEASKELIARAERAEEQLEAKQKRLDWYERLQGDASDADFDAVVREVLHSNPAKERQ